MTPLLARLQQAIILKLAAVDLSKYNSYEPFLADINSDHIIVNTYRIDL